MTINAEFRDSGIYEFRNSGIQGLKNQSTLWKNKKSPSLSVLNC
jgi:hypothetical protein